MTTFESVKEFLKKLQDTRYLVSGGYAIEAIRGEITREHKDFDIYVFNEDITRLFDDLKESGYRCFRNLNKYEIQYKDLIVDVLPLKKINDQRVIIGNSADTYYPSEIFNLENFYNLAGASLRLVPNEVLVLEMKHSKHPEDKKVAESLPYNQDYFSKIKNISKDKPEHIPLEEI